METSLECGKFEEYLSLLCKSHYPVNEEHLFNMSYLNIYENSITEAEYQLTRIKVVDWTNKQDAAIF